MTDDTDHAEARRYFDLRMEDIRQAMTNSNAQERLLNDCLAIDATITLNVQLSTGGPGDGFEIVCDAATGEPIRGNHYFVNWGYRREFSLSEDQLADVCTAYGIEGGRQFIKL